MKRLLAFVSMMTLLSSVRAIESKELTDENFEHDTQATTGGTAGDFLILFCEMERF